MHGLFDSSSVVQSVGLNQKVLVKCIESLSGDRWEDISAACRSLDAHTTDYMCTQSSKSV